MDNLTHSLVGALIGQAGLKRRTGLAMPALIIGANLPDVDAACFFWLDGVEHLAFRRGITHGPPALVLLPLLLAGALWGWDRWQARRGTRPDGRLPVRFGWLYALAFLGCVTHPALDWMNVYGIRLLEPFSSRWFHGDVLFIIDLWLWLGMGFAVWLSLRREKDGGEWRRVARIALAAALAYVGVNAGITWKAEHDFEKWFGLSIPHQAIANPLPVTFWKRGVLVGSAEASWHAFVTPYDNHQNGLLKPLADRPCDLKVALTHAKRTRDLDAFLFWSRAPFAERAVDGSVIIRDARFADGLTSRGFSVPLPDVACVEPPTPRAG